MPRLEAAQIDLSESESHWSARELALVMVEQCIVESISERHVGRLLKEADARSGGFLQV
jgi:hypothetical protein